MHTASVSVLPCTKIKYTVGTHGHFGESFSGVRTASPLGACKHDISLRNRHSEVQRIPVYGEFTCELLTCPARGAAPKNNKQRYSNFPVA